MIFKKGKTETSPEVVHERMSGVRVETIENPLMRE